jgi:hypothetical protein
VSELGRERGAGVPVGLDRLALGADLQRDQRRGAADRDHVAAGEAGLVLHHDQPAPDLFAEHDRRYQMTVQYPGYRDRPNHKCPIRLVVGERLAHLRQVGDLGLEQARNGAIARPFGQRHRDPVAARAEDRARLAEQPREAARQVLQRASFEDKIGELLVDRGRAAQRRELAARRLELRVQLQPHPGLGDGDRGEVGEGTRQLDLVA